MGAWQLLFCFPSGVAAVCVGMDNASLPFAMTHSVSLDSWHLNRHGIHQHCCSMSGSVVIPPERFIEHVWTTNTSLSTVFICFWRWQLLKQRQNMPVLLRSLDMFRLYLRFCHTRTSSFHRSKVIQLAAQQPLADRAAPRSLMRSLRTGWSDESLSCHQYFCRPRLSFTFTSCMVFTAGSMSESSRRAKDREVPDQRGSGGRVWKWSIITVDPFQNGSLIYVVCKGENGGNRLELGGTLSPHKQSASSLAESGTAIGCQGLKGLLFYVVLAKGMPKGSQGYWDVVVASLEFVDIHKRWTELWALSLHRRKKELLLDGYFLLAIQSWFHIWRS